MGSIMNSAKPIKEFKGGKLTVIVGASTTGKTTLASSFPKPQLFIDMLDKGLDSIKDVEGTDFISVKPMKTKVKGKTKKLDKFQVLDNLITEMFEEPDKYNSYVIDTITACEESRINSIRKANGNKMNRSLWGECSSYTKQLILRLNDFCIEHDKHVILIVQSQIIEVDDDDDIIKPSVEPALMRSVINTINSLANDILHTIKREVENDSGEMEVHYLTILSSSAYRAKVRKPKKVKIPSEVRDLTFEKLELIKQGKPYDVKKAKKSKKNKKRGK